MYSVYSAQNYSLQQAFIAIKDFETHLGRAYMFSLVF